MRHLITIAAAMLTTPLWAEVPKVVTDLPVVQSLTAQVMGDLGEPALLLEQGASAHGFQLRPSQTAALAKADLVIWVGPEMTPWLDRAIDGLGVKANALSLLDAPGTYTRSFGEAPAQDHAAHDHAHHDHAHHGVDSIDPHAWLDPANATHWLGLIAAALAGLDPENAAVYGANASAASARVAALDAALADRLAPAKGKPFVVFHDAYGYFADHYGLSVAGAIAAGDAATPGAAGLASIRQTLSQNGALCIFPETLHDPKLVTTVIEGTDTRLGGPLDPEGSSLPPGPALYETLMTDLAKTLADCLK